MIVVSRVKTSLCHTLDFPRIMHITLSALLTKATRCHAVLCWIEIALKDATLGEENWSWTS